MQISRTCLFWPNLVFWPLFRASDTVSSFIFKFSYWLCTHKYTEKSCMYHDNCLKNTRNSELDQCECSQSIFWKGMEMWKPHPSVIKYALSPYDFTFGTFLWHYFTRLSFSLFRSVNVSETPRLYKTVIYTIVQKTVLLIELIIVPETNLKNSLGFNTFSWQLIGLT